MSRNVQTPLLLWEALAPGPIDDATAVPAEPTPAKRVTHLPYETQCSAITKAGRRCRGRVRPGTGFCVFHDPNLSAERRRQIAARGGRNRHRLGRLPDGYLRKLTSRRAVGDAMDRLYREIRLGKITPEMGTVLFAVLTRILDAGLCDGGQAPPNTGRSRAEKIRPKLSELLTRAERAAWRKAAAHASARSAPTSPRPTTRPQRPTADDTAEQVKLPGKLGMPLPT